MADDFVSRRHAEIDAEIHLNDSQVAMALDTVARCRQRLVDLPVAVKVVADSLLQMGRGPAEGSCGDWTLDDVAEFLHDNTASWTVDIARARIALDELETALRSWEDG
jgi:hypothetical protein